MKTTTLLFLALFPVATHGQKAPQKPQLPPGADVNDPVSYVRLGESLLKDRPDKAEAAFFWASRLAPGAADILYSLWAARLLARPLLSSN
jgi:hypothetical protein